MSERVQKPVYPTANGSTVRGLITYEDPTQIDNAFQSVQNILITSKGFGPRRGSSLVGTNDNTGTAGQGVTSLFTYKLSNTGSTTIKNEIMLRAHSTYLEWFNEEGGASGKWHTLVSGLTADKIFGFAPFNTTTLSTAVNRLFFGNGVENYSEWNGATTVLNGALVGAEATINVDDTTLFSASGSLIINGSTVTYSGKSGTTFTGCSGTPAASDNDGVAQLPDTSTYSARPKINFMLTAFSRVFGFGGSGTVQGNRLHYSQAGTSAAAPDPTNFTAASALVDPGFRDFPEGGDVMKAIAQVDDKIVVFKEHGIYTYTFDFTQSTTKFDIVGAILEGPDVGCGALGAISKAVNQIYYVSKRGGLKTLNLQPGTPLLRPLQITERVLPTIVNFDNNNAKIHYNSKNNFILVSTASATGIENDTLIVYDIRRDALTFCKNIAGDSFTEYKGDSYFGAATTAKVYRLFNGFTDNGANINASAKTQTYTFGDVGSPKALDSYYVEGYIKSGKELNIRFDFDDNTQSYKQITLMGDTAKDYIYALQPNTFGEFEFGEFPFGGDPEDFSDLYIFRVYLKIENTQAYNTAVTFWSSGPGESWFIRNHGWAPVITQSELPKNVLYL